MFLKLLLLKKLGHVVNDVFLRCGSHEAEQMSGLCQIVLLKGEGNICLYLLLVQTKHLKQLGLVALKRFVGLHKIFGILGYSYAYGTNEQHDEEENEEIVVQNSVACGC